MKKIIITIAAMAFAVSAFAETSLVFGFDNNTEPNGIQYLGADQLISFSGAVSGSGQTDFNLLNGASALVNFSTGAAGDLPFFSGTLTPVGGTLYMGASGGGLSSTGNGSEYFDTASEGWTFTFSRDVVLTAVNFYAPDAGQQVISTNGTAISGSPFDDDFSGSLFLKAGDSLTFGYNAGGTGTYGLDDFTITVIPEPATFAMLGVGGLAVMIIRRASRA
jgi:hypothetical protein